MAFRHWRSITYRKLEIDEAYTYNGSLNQSSKKGLSLFPVSSNLAGVQTLEQIEKNIEVFLFLVLIFFSLRLPQILVEQQIVGIPC